MAISDFLAGVLAKLPESSRAQAQAAFEDANAAEALKELDNGVLRQSDYSRKLDETRAAREQADLLYQQNSEWWTANQPVLEAGKRALAGTTQPVVNPTTTSTGPTLTMDEVEKLVGQRLNQFSQEALGVVAATNGLTLRHYAEFGEQIDMPALIAAAQKNKVSLQAQYDTQFKPQYDAKAAKAEEARVAALRKEIEAEVRQKYAATAIPYPVGHTQPSTLDGLGQPADRQSDFSAAAAAAEYEQRVAARATLGG